MLQIIGVILTFVLIVVLRLRNFNFSLTMIIASIMIAITSNDPGSVVFYAVSNTLTDPNTFNICAAVALITVLGYNLKETSLISELIEGLKNILPSRILLSLIPAMFGLLSTPGGALMSAPFNEPEAKRLGLSPEQKTYINVWFRHLWYWASPISPVPILASSLVSIKLLEFLSAQLPMLFVTLTIGLGVTLTFMDKDNRDEEKKEGYSKIFKGLSPIIIAIALSSFGVPIWIALTIGIVIVFILTKVPAKKAMEMVRKGVSWGLVASAFSMLFFRHIVILSGSVGEILNSITASGIPLLLILIITPILVGVISGTPTMGIGIIFPLLLPLLDNNNVHFVSVIYAGVICGYLSSPMHLCLILTNSYYKSELGLVYRYLVPSAFLLYAANVVYHLFMSGSLLF